MSDFLDRSKLPHLHINVTSLWCTKRCVDTHLAEAAVLYIYCTCEAFIVRQDTPHLRERLFHATMPSSARSAHPNSQFAQHSVYPRTKRFRGEMSSSSVGRPFQSLIASCLEIRPMGSALPPPAPRPHTLGKAVKADFSFVRSAALAAAAAPTKTFN